MKRFDARAAVLQALKDKGLYRDTKENPMVVPICRYIHTYYCDICTKTTSFECMVGIGIHPLKRGAYVIPECPL